MAASVLALNCYSNLRAFYLCGRLPSHSPLFSSVCGCVHLKWLHGSSTEKRSCGSLWACLCVWRDRSPGLVSCGCTNSPVNKTPASVCLGVMLRNLICGFSTGLRFGPGRKMKSVGFTLVCPCKNVSPSWNCQVTAVTGSVLGPRISHIKARNAVDFLDSQTHQVLYNKMVYYQNHLLSNLWRPVSWMLKSGYNLLNVTKSLFKCTFCCVTKENGHKRKS